MDQATKHWFSRTYLDLFRSQIDYYRNSVSERLLPTFAALHSEAEHFERQETERISRIALPEMDPSIIAEIICDRTIEFYTTLSGIRQGMINLLTAGLFHLFEQQVSQLVRVFNHETDDENKLFARLRDILETQHCDANNLPHWNILTIELRLVANVVKHGPGTSAKKLSSIRPELFRQDHVDSDKSQFTSGVNAKSPIAGDGLFLKENDFNLYADAISGFWGAFSCWNDN